MFTLKILSLSASNPNDASTDGETSNTFSSSLFDVWAQPSFLGRDATPADFWEASDFATLSSDRFFDYTKESKKVPVSEASMTTLANASLVVNIYISPKGKAGVEDASALVGRMPALSLVEMVRSGSHTGFYPLEAVEEKDESRDNSASRPGTAATKDKNEDSNSPDGDNTKSDPADGVETEQTSDVPSDADIAEAKVALTADIQGSTLEIDLSMGEDLTAFGRVGRMVELCDFSLREVSEDFLKSCKEKPLRITTQTFGMCSEDPMAQWQIGNGMVELKELSTENKVETAEKTNEVTTEEEAGTGEAKGDDVEGNSEGESASNTEKDKLQKEKSVTWGDASLRVFLSRNSIDAMIENDDDFVTWPFTVEPSSLTGTTTKGEIDSKSRPVTSATVTSTSSEPRPTGTVSLIGACDLLDMFSEDVCVIRPSCIVQMMQKEGEDPFIGKLSFRVSFDEALVAATDFDTVNQISIDDIVEPRPLVIQPSVTDARKSFRREAENTVNTVLKHILAEKRESGSNGKDLRRQVMFRLNESGDYYLFKEKLKRSVVLVVQERKQRDPSLDHKSDEFISMVYKDLLEDCNVAITRLVNAVQQGGPMQPLGPADLVNGGNDDGAASSKSLAAESNESSEVQDTLTLALEADINEDGEIAGKMYEKQLLQAETLPCTSEELLKIKKAAIVQSALRAGRSALYFGDVKKAENYFRRVLSVECENCEALKALGSILLSQGDFEKSSCLFRGVVDKKTCAQSVSWLALHHHVAQIPGRFKNKNWPRISRGGGQKQSDALVAIADQLLQLRLLNLAEVALQLACNAFMDLDNSVHRRIVEGNLLLDVEDFEHAESTLREGIELCKDALNKAKLCGLLAETLFQQKKNEEARQTFEAAVEEYGDQKVPSKLYLRLGNLYLQEEKFELAREIFLRASRDLNCSTFWLGVGVACMRNGQLCDADDALVEANILSKSNPKVWGYLTLLCLQWKDSDRKKEALSSLEEAFKLGLGESSSDAPLLVEISEACREHRLYREAELASSKALL
eukprot:g1845.t1